VNEGSDWALRRDWGGVRTSRFSDYMMVPDREMSHTKSDSLKSGCGPNEEGPRMERCSTRGGHNEE